MTRKPKRAYANATLARMHVGGVASPAHSYAPPIVHYQAQLITLGSRWKWGGGEKRRKLCVYSCAFACARVRLLNVRAPHTNYALHRDAGANHPRSYRTLNQASSQHNSPHATCGPRERVSLSLSLRLSVRPIYNCSCVGCTIVDSNTLAHKKHKLMLLCSTADAYATRTDVTHVLKCLNLMHTL